MLTFYTIASSVVGDLLLASDGTHLTHVLFMDALKFEGIPSSWVRDDMQSVLCVARTQLDEYFSCKRQIFNLALGAQGSELQEDVWRAVSEIPAGSFMTYAQLASKIGKPKAVRAVATAVGKNPLCIVVPCHRVVPAAGGVGQYAGGSARKKTLLALEGIAGL